MEIKYAIAVMLVLCLGLSGCQELPDYSQYQPAGSPVQETESQDEVLEVSQLIEEGTIDEAPLQEEKPDIEEDTEEEPAEPVKEIKHLDLSLPDSGYDIFVPSSRRSKDYRYGPTILLNEDGSMDAWFAAPGDGIREYDWVSYRHSDDGGQTWSQEKIVLYPTPNSPDALSCCDPDVFYYDGYYYIGYTSTTDSRGKGINNSAFLARSQKPDGPFEKWNGSGWGGKPSPIIQFEDIWTGWGIGEPAFVVLNDAVFVYVTRDVYYTIDVRSKTTELFTAQLDGEDWPLNLVYRGSALNRNDSQEGDEYIYSDCDSLDVAYVEEAGKFLAVAANRRFKNNSCLVYFESDNGFEFERVSEINKNVMCRCHNCGIMSDANGHIKAGDPTLIGYAYAGSGTREWGVWSTRFAPLTLELVDEIDRSGEE